MGLRNAEGSSHPFHFTLIADPHTVVPSFLGTVLLIHLHKTADQGSILAALALRGVQVSASQVWRLRASAFQWIFEQRSNHDVLRPVVCTG